MSDHNVVTFVIPNPTHMQKIAMQEMQKPYLTPCDRTFVTERKKSDKPKIRTVGK